LENIQRNNGKVNETSVIIPVQTPAAVMLEQGFAGLKPMSKISFWNNDVTDTTFSFEGVGFVLKGEAVKKENVTSESILQVKITIDNNASKTISMPTDYRVRSNDIFWIYDLPKGKHNVHVQLLNPSKEYELHTTEYIVYDGKK